jgi:hypothetical protein
VLLGDRLHFFRFAHFFKKKDGNEFEVELPNRKLNDLDEPRSHKNGKSRDKSRQRADGLHMGVDQDHR